MQPSVLCARSTPLCVCLPQKFDPSLSQGARRNSKVLWNCELPTFLGLLRLPNTDCRSRSVRAAAVENREHPAVMKSRLWVLGRLRSASKKGPPFPNNLHFLTVTLSKVIEHLVGAGRFERPTPCAQGSPVRCDAELRRAPEGEGTVEVRP